MNSNDNSQPDPSPEEISSQQSLPPQEPKPWRSLFLILILLGLGGGISLGWYLIYRQLPQTVAKSLSSILSRPVEVGEVEAFSLTSLSFGETTLPPTDEHTEQVTIPTVAVNFTPFKVITEQALDLEVTLINPEVKVEQTPEGQWLTTELTEQPPGFIDIRLNRLNVENANLSLASRNQTGELQPPVNLNIAQINSQFLDNNQRIPFQLENLTLAEASGSIDLTGEANLETEEVALSLTTNELAIAQLARLAASPLNIRDGTLNANTDISFFLNDTLPKLEGTAELTNLEARLEPFTTPFQATEAKVNFSERDIFVENFTTQWGDLEAVAGGKLNLETGYDLNANITPTSLASIFSAFEIDSPEFPLSSTIEANLSLTGALDEPQVNITANTTEPTVIDQVAFSQVQTQLSLQGNELIVEDLIATPQAGGEITAQGNLDLTSDQAINLDVGVQDVSGEVIRPYQSDLPSDLGTLNAGAKIKGNLADWQNLSGQGNATLAIANGEVTLPQLEFLDGRLQGRINIDSLQPQRLNPNIPPQLQNPISGEFFFNADLADLSPEQVTLNGEGELNIPQGQLAATAINLSQGQLNANVDVTNFPIGLIAPETPAEFNELLSAQFQANADIRDFDLNQVEGRGFGEVTLTGAETSRIRLNDLRLSDGNWRGDIDVRNLEVGRFAQEMPLELQGTRLDTQLTAQGTIDNLTPEGVTIEGSGMLNLVGREPSRINLDNLRLSEGNWRGDIKASNLDVGRLLPDIPPQVQGSLFDAQLTAEGTLDNLTSEGVTIEGSGELKRILDGNIRATRMRLQEGAFELVAIPENLNLSQLSEELQGGVAGEVKAQGNLADLSPSGITAQANLDFDQGLSLIDDSLTTRLRWDGRQVVLEEAEAEDFFAEGTIAVDLEQQRENIIENVDLTVDAQNLDLAALSIPEPEAIGELNIQGLAGFTGEIQGNISQPQIEGDIRLENFALNRFIFDSEMTGTVLANAEQGVRFNLEGENEESDQIQFALLSPTEGEFLPLEPTSFRVKYQEALAEGNQEEDDLMVSLNSLPLDLLRDFAPLPEEFADQPASGTLEGDFAVNLNNYGISGELGLINPALGRFNSDRATATFSYLNQTLKISEATLIQNESSYRANGRLSLTETTPEFQGNLDIEKGRIEDILTAIQVFDLADFNEEFLTPGYGDADDLNTTSVNVQDQPLEDQLRRFSEIKALLEQLRSEPDPTPLLPPLDLAQGNFTGQVYVQGSSFNLADLQAEWEIDGESWQWGPYLAKTVTAQGNLRNGVITLLPLRFASDDSFINLSGTFGGDNQSAQLQVNEIPVAELKNLVELPEFIGVSGLINGTATVAGSPQNPSARGELRVVDAVLNEKTIETVQGSFNYSNSELNLFARGLLTSESEPLTVVGEIPYQLPFAEIPPTSEDLNLEINLEDEGFALLDVISNGQLTWEGGTGQVNLTVSGPFDPEDFQIEQLTTQGVLNFSEASIATAVLPQPLTNINSRVNFNLDQLNVEQFNADFGGGEVNLSGGLALFNPEASTESLDLDLDNLALDLPNLYQGDVTGDINISRSAIAPEIGGDITVSQGEVLLAEEEENGIAQNGQQNGQENGANIGFNDLKITLGENVNVTRQPILNFLADGSLVLNGTLDNIRPEGTISLRQGQVNLGLTQFRLAKGYEQTATFIPTQGFDPTLDVRLITSVSETSGSLGGSDGSTEFQDQQLDTSVASLRSVQVEALVRGRASELQPGALTANNDILTLSSEPSRSETEILALLGGGLTRGFGDDAALGLANIAGSTLLGTFQNTIGDALGLSEFRIFPTLIPTEREEGEDGGGSSTLGFGAEAGINIGNDFSVSALTIFDTDQKIQYSVRYRLDDSVLLRGTTDFADNDNLIIEYETRF
ncbi:MAG: translocation/assembly module TamB domain-containing protein [Halothece sp.]